LLRDAGGNMKKIFLGMLGVVAMAVPAVAADLPAKTYTKAPPPIPAPVYDWTGFYIGANGGWGQSRSCWDFVTLAGVQDVDACLTKSGGLIGGQAGYRWQMGQVVFGLEAQGDWANIHASRVSLINQNFTLNSKLDGLGLFTGQIGYAWGPSLLYLKGGAAVTSDNFFISQTLTGVSLASISSTRWGGTVGVGWEYLITPNFSIGVEYDHLFMGNANNSFSVVNPIVASALNRIDQNVDMITARFNWKFGGMAAAPVVSKY
jgi:outer membrane immunogenic protein